jgi:hypothetical protein
MSAGGDRVEELAARLAVARRRLAGMEALLAPRSRERELEAELLGVEARIAELEAVGRADGALGRPEGEDAA